MIQYIIVVNQVVTQFSNNPPSLMRSWISITTLRVAIRPKVHCLKNPAMQKHVDPTLLVDFPD